MANADLPVDPSQLAEHLRGLTPEQLAEVEASLVSQFDEAYGDGTNPNLDLERLAQLTDQITATRSEIQVRETEATERAAEAASLRDRIHGNQPEETPEATAEGAESNTQEGETEVTEPTESAAVEALAASLMRAIDAGVRRVPVENVIRDDRPSLNRHLRLGQVAQHAPAAQVPENRPRTLFQASADIPGFTQGGEINDMMALVQAMHARARRLPVSTNGQGTPVPVAGLERNFRYRLGLDATPDQINEVLTAAMDVDTLVAAGGWCAPSEISYDFFNLVCEDGMVDLPTVGVVNRGGIRFPISPSFADIIAGSPSGLWTWTETDDQAAVTGSPTKTCVRIDCPDFDEVRLVCEGLCVTAGNLIDFAYPEQIANFVRILMAARAHLTNSRIIGILEAASTGVTMAGPSGGFTGDLMNAVELQAIDYRAKYAMCEDAILESLFPTWVLGALRSDWMRRNHVASPSLATAAIMDWFDDRNVRAQFVQDWQQRSDGFPGEATPITDWPATVDFMLYAPGTFVRGQGLRLDLGVVRDSTLNETNDHTAAWMEDCYLVAQPGHESRVVTANVCVAGTTGAADITC